MSKTQGSLHVQLEKRFGARRFLVRFLGAVTIERKVSLKQTLHVEQVKEHIEILTSLNRTVRDLDSLTWEASFHGTRLERDMTNASIPDVHVYHISPLKTCSNDLQPEQCESVGITVEMTHHGFLNNPFWKTDAVYSGEICWSATVASAEKSSIHRKEMWAQV